MSKRFIDKVCLVTGGGSGIGRATCKQFAIEGGKVIVVDNNDANGNETVQIIKAIGGHAIFCRADVAISSNVQEVVKLVVNEWKRIDVLINNAAIMTFKRTIDLSEEEWDRVIEVNLRSVFLFCKYCIPYMDHGVIVNVSSVHAHETQSNVTPYATSKGGMEAFTRALSQEYDPSHIRVNCIAPGGVDTPMLWSNPVIKSMNKEDVTFLSAEQIATIICFLASNEACPINGATIVADKGLLTKL